MRSPHVCVRINLAHTRAAAEDIRRRTGVPLIAVIKADAYGLGAARVADALAPAVNEFAFFYAEEAIAIGRQGLVLGPPDVDAEVYRAHGLRPAVGAIADAERLRGLPVAVKVDSGMQRFGCPPEQLDALIERCGVVDFMTHAVEIDAVERFRRACDGRGKPMHAASSSLLGEPGAWLDAVRPGVALYRGAVRVTTRLHSVRDTRGPVGYTGFEQPRVGAILCGYSNGLRPAPLLINGQRQRTLEIGMNTSFVTVSSPDRPGDEVVLLGDRLSEDELAADARSRPHEILCRYAAMGPRVYEG